MKSFVTSTFFTVVLAATASMGQSANEARMFDRLQNVYCEDEKARLDNFAIQLSNEPDAKAYIVVYGGRLNTWYGKPKLPIRGEAQARAARLKPYLVHSGWKIDPERIIFIDGGYRETFETELWIVPKGSTPPKLTPTVEANKIQFRRGRAKAADYICEV